MKQKKIWMAVCMVVCLGCMFLNGCGKSPGSTNQVILTDEKNTQEATILHFFAPIDTASDGAMYYRELIDQYNTQNTDCQVVFEGISVANGFNEYLEQRLDADQGDDVFIVNADLVKPLYHKGYFYDLSTFQVFQQLNDSAKEQAMIGDIAYCLPVDMTAYCLFVNLDVLDQYDLQPPKNLEEFQTCCQTIKTAGGTPLSLNRWYALTVPAMANGLYKVYSAENTQEIRNGLNNGEIQIANYMLEGFQVVEGFIQQGWYGDGLDTATVDSIPAGIQDIPDFANGNTAFYFGHLNAMSLIEDTNPKLNYIVQGVPIPNGTVTLPAALTRLCINANSDYLDETIDFVNYLTSNQYQKISANGNGILPIYNEVDFTLSSERMRPAYETFITGGQIPIEDMQLQFTYWDTIRELCINMFDHASAEEAAAEYNKIQMEQIAQYKK